MSEIQDNVLALPRKEKVRIFEALKADLAKFDDEVLPILSERAQDFVPGETETVPAGSVFAKLKDKYQKADS